MRYAAFMRLFVLLASLAAVLAAGDLIGPN